MIGGVLVLENGSKMKRKKRIAALYLLAQL
jgi:hypothetical protein